MTETTSYIFENHQVRKTKKQKTAFINWVTPIIEKAGYSVEIEPGSMGARNIVIGNPDTADVVFTAHYDTCAVLPFPNFCTPKSPLIYILFQIMLCIPFFVIGFGVTYLALLLGVPQLAALGPIILLALCVLIIAGPANKHTANDNTSGVTAVLDTMNAMPTELRERAAFVLFDLEEAGLFGSGGFASWHKQAMKNKLLVNFDCVSDGKNMLFVVKRKAKGFIPLLEQAYGGQNKYGIKTEFVYKGAIYPSDQANFPLGVGAVALNSTKSGILYMNKIHTKRDTVYQGENIEFLAERSVGLVGLLTKDK